MQLKAATRMPEARERDRLEVLSTMSLSLSKQANVLVRLRRSWRDGTTQLKPVGVVEARHADRYAPAQPHPTPLAAHWSGEQVRYKEFEISCQTSDFIS